jgi:hypothetical protein
MSVPDKQPSTNNADDDPRCFPWVVLDPLSEILDERCRRGRWWGRRGDLEISQRRDVDFRERRDPRPIPRDIYPEPIRDFMNVGETLGDGRDSRVEVLLDGMNGFFELVEGRHQASSWLGATVNSIQRHDHLASKTGRKKIPTTRLSLFKQTTVLHDTKLDGANADDSIIFERV